MTREEWLNEIIARARPLFEAAGSPLPEKVRAAISPPTKKTNYLGLCWSDGCSEDGGREIWVTATQSDQLEIASILVHELTHAALAFGEKHGKNFKKLAAKMLLEGKAKHMAGGSLFREVWKPILAEIGPYPGSRFVASGASKSGEDEEGKISFKNISCPCCGFAAKVRVNQMEMGRLVCPVEGEMLLTRDEKKI